MLSFRQLTTADLAVHNEELVSNPYKFLSANNTSDDFVKKSSEFKSSILHPEPDLKAVSLYSQDDADLIDVNLKELERIIDDPDRLINEYDHVEISIRRLACIRLMELVRAYSEICLINDNSHPRQESTNLDINDHIKLDGPGSLILWHDNPNYIVPGIYLEYDEGYKKEETGKDNKSKRQVHLCHLIYHLQKKERSIDTILLNPFMESFGIFEPDLGELISERETAESIMASLGIKSDKELDIEDPNWIYGFQFRRQLNQIIYLTAIPHRDVAITANNSNGLIIKTRTNHVFSEADYLIFLTLAYRSVLLEKLD